MDVREFLVAVLAGTIQGVAEWLPVSSQGNLAMFLTLAGASADDAIRLSLFLQLGTTLAAASYYRGDLLEATRTLPEWRPQTAFDGGNAESSFVVLASLTTGLVGIPVYVLAVDVATDLSAGAFVAAIGLLLVATGTLQRTSESVGLGDRDEPSLRDALLVGAVQGIAILPGVSRSGVTTSALLVEGYDGASAFRLSFLLSIPAGVGAAVLTVADAGGLPEVGLAVAGVALAVSVLVGYVAIDALLAVVERIPFWAVCYGLGGLAVLGGGLVLLV